VTKQFNHQGTGSPNDARWHRHGDIRRKWAVTRRTPICQLVASGKTWGFTCSFPPPGAMIGQRIGLHCGTSAVKQDDISDAARGAIAKLTGHPLEDWNLGLRELKAEAGQMVGSAVLVAAFRTDGLNITDTVRIFRFDSEGHKYLPSPQGPIARVGYGQTEVQWSDYHGKLIRPVGDWTSGRWVWAFAAPVATVAGARGAVLPGVGAGLWDVGKQIAIVKKKMKQTEGVVS